MARDASRLASSEEHTVKEVADKLGVSTSTVNNYLHERRDNFPQLKGAKRGHAWYVLKADLKAFMDLWPNMRPVSS